MGSTYCGVTFFRIGAMATPFLLLVFIIQSALALPKSNGVHIGVNVVLGSAEDIKSAAANTSHALKVGNKGGSRNAELEKAIQNRDVQKAKHTINSGEDVNAYDSDGCPQFSYDNPELVQTLIEQGADVNCVGQYAAWTPLISALYDHHIQFLNERGCNGLTHVPMPPNRVKVLKLLVEAGADIDHLATPPGPEGSYEYWSTSALLKATWRACWNVEAIKLFVSSGANVNIKSIHMFTPLIYASSGVPDQPGYHGYSPANLEIVELLVSKGADVNAIECLSCGTALDHAIKTKEYAVAEYLKKHGGVEGGHCPADCPPVHPWPTSESTTLY